jgi:hypothetical protein
MDILLHLTDEQTLRATEMAQELGVQPDELVRAAVADALNGPSEKVKAAVSRILAEDLELYRRLA